MPQLQACCLPHCLMWGFWGLQDLIPGFLKIHRKQGWVLGCRARMPVLSLSLARDLEKGFN